MANEIEAISITIKSTTHIPIAELNDRVPQPATRSVRAIVTLTWPYSSATGSIAFLLAEPDFRLRRSNGQVRVQFSGSSAKQVAKAGIASGDEVTMCLDGVEWMRNEAEISTPGRGVEFELKFAERLLLQFQQEGSPEINLIDIDHPVAEPEVPVRIPSPESSASPSPSTPSIYSRPTEINGNEWSSPAFIKRARTSYGSFFDNNYDPYTEEDGTIPGKGRKKTRLSSTWRYSSRSPTPESDPAPENGSLRPAEAPAKAMADEACQTIDAEIGDAAEALADFSRQVTNVGSTPRTEAASVPEDQTIFQPEVGLETQNNAIPSPIVQTQINHEIEVSPKIETARAGAFRTASQPPRSEPIPSDAPPFLSPFVTSNFGLVINPLNGMTPVFQGNTTFEQNAPHPGSEMMDQKSAADALPPKAAPQALDEDFEDLYGVSPIGRHGDSQFQDHNDFTEDMYGFSGVPHASEGQFVSEDQYGHWQSATAQLSLPTSPPNAEAPTEDPQEGDEGTHFGDDSFRTFQNNGLPLLDDHGQHTHQYPEPEDELHVPSFNSRWLPDQNSASVSYPDLPPPDDETRNASHRSPYLQAPFMSRSQSAQSEVVNLTASDDEQPEELPVEDEEGDEMSEGSGEEETYSRDGHMQRPYLSLNGEDEAEADISQYSGDGYEFDEDEVGADQLYLDEEEEYCNDDEESSYDEEEMDNEEPRPAQPGSPVVIDLLSSDDEDATEKFAPKAARPTWSLQQREHSGDDERIKTKESDDENLQGEYLEPSSTGLNSPGRTQPGESAGEGMIAGDGEDEDDIASLENVSDAGTEILGQVTAIGVPQPASSDSDVEEGSYEDQRERLELELTGISGPGYEVEKLPRDGGLKLVNEQDFEACDVVAIDASGQETSPPRVEKLSGENPPSAMSEIYGMDGVNDTKNKVLSSALERGGNSVVISGFERYIQTPSTPDTIDTGAVQLPTPDDTQISRTIASQVSFSFTSGQQPVADPSQETSSQVPFDPAHEDKIDTADHSEHAHEMGNICFIENDIEPVSVTEGRAEKLPERERTSDLEGDIEMTTVADVVATSLPGEGQPRKESRIYPNLNVSEEAPSSSGDISSNPREGEDFGDASIVNVEDLEPETAETPKVQIEIENLSSNAKTQPASVEDAAQELHSVLSVPVPGNESIEETVQASPRRSQRIGKPASSDSETVGPTTPIRPRHRAEPNNNGYIDTLSSPVLNDSATPSGHDPSIEMALSALDSPQKRLHDLRRQPVADLKVLLSRALRRELGDFTALKVLRYNLNKKLDVLAIATTTPDEPQRSKGGPRNFQMTFNITDPSIAPSGVTEVQILRPYREALPVISVGNGILLRNFQVISLKDKGFALRSGQSEGSSWAVFTDGEEDADVRGPPVEYGAVERKYFVSLGEWFRSLDSAAAAKLSRANANKAK